MCSPRPPEVLGNPRIPSSSRTSSTTCATRRIRGNVQSGIGSRSIRHSSGDSGSSRREFQGWNSTVDICTAQITDALTTGRVVRFLDADVDVPLFWQYWKLSSPLLDAVTQIIVDAARTELLPAHP